MRISLRRVVRTIVLVCLVGISAQAGLAQTTAGYAGGGVIQAGDTWESFLPQGFVPNNSDVPSFSSLGARTFLRIGNFDRQWTTPGTNWPAAYPLTIHWYKNAMLLAYDPDPTFNPATINGVANPSYIATSRNTTNPYAEFAQATYSERLSGAVPQSGSAVKAGARNYAREPYWVDGLRRQHQVYEAGWPTNLGVDVKLRAHGFQGPNWNNLNDFVIVEIELKNTGALDMNMDGIPEKINNDLKALAFQVSGEGYMSASTYGTGSRSMDLITSQIVRQSCWITDVDENGEPWAFTFYRAGPSTLNPTTGNWDHGMIGGVSKNYTDIHTGWVMLDAKIGGLPANAAQSVINNPTKYTIWGNHPIGTGQQRGWFVSGQNNRFVHYITDPRKMFYATLAAYFVDGGRSHTTTSFNSYNLNPNAAMFSSGAAGDVLSFVPKSPASWTRPDGSMQAAGQFDQVSTEDGRADAVTDYPTGYGKFSSGASHSEAFDGDAYSGIGPFSLKKDSSMTLVFATVAGYRLEGIQKAVRAARWTYMQNYQMPQLPPLPEVQITGRPDRSFVVDWDIRAEADPEFAGYKIWRSAQADTSQYINEGMRIVDKYQEQMVPGPRPASVFKPVNPKFDGIQKSLDAAGRGKYAPDTWGTWVLLKTVTKSELAQLPHASSPAYTYAYVDSNVVPGRYWYYVSAFKDGNYTGPGGEVASRIETHNTNRNGATGLWNKTYPYASINANFPKDPQGLKNIGAAVQCLRVVATPVLSFGSVTLGTSREYSLRLRNSSGQAISVRLASSSSAFVSLDSLRDIPAADSILVKIRYTPTRMGRENATYSVSVIGFSNTDSVRCSGDGIAGSKVPVVAWESFSPDPSATTLVASNPSGTIYSAMVNTSGGMWTLKKHGGSGQPAWTYLDTAYFGGFFPNLIGLQTTPSGNPFLVMNGAQASGSSPTTVSKISPAGQALWHTSFILPSNRNMVTSKTTTDDNGNTFAVGYSYASVSGNNTCLTTTKVNDAGSVEWLAQYEGPAKSDSSDVGSAIARDSSGSIYVTGYTGGTPGGEMLTIKYSPTGTVQWVSTFNGSVAGPDDRGVGIAVGAYGDIFVLGTCSGAGTGSDIVLLKYRASDGVLLWDRRWDGPFHASDVGSAIVAASDGGVVIAGSVSEATSVDALVIRYSSDGVLEGKFQYDGPAGGNDYLGFLQQDAGGSLYAAGNSIGSLGAVEVVVLKLNSSLGLEWEGRYSLGAGIPTTPSSTTLGAAGQVIIGGIRSPAAAGVERNAFVVAMGQTTVSVPQSLDRIPSSFALKQNYPNPFNPTSTIGFDIPTQSHVSITLYNTLGQIVQEIFRDVLPAGYHEVRVNASGLASGVYFYQMKSGQFLQTLKLVVLK